jgi:hypothetical protein
MGGDVATDSSEDLSGIGACGFDEEGNAWGLAAGDHAVRKNLSIGGGCLY